MESVLSNIKDLSLSVVVSLSVLEGILRYESPDSVKVDDWLEVSVLLPL